MRRALAVLAAICVAGTAYGAADVADVVPGVLTRDDPSVVAEITPTMPSESAAPVLDAAGTDAPVPTRGGLVQDLNPLVRDPWIGPRVGLVVRDALTGDVLYDHDGDTAMTPASTAKVLTAAAISERADLTKTMTTTVVEGASPDELVLVAGGDTMIAAGAGNPDAVEGRAGMRDLARSVVARLKATKGDTYRLRLDATYAHGPRYPKTWSQVDVAQGFTQAITMIGLAGERPEPYQPSPRYPERSALEALKTELAKAGVTVTVDDSVSGWTRAAPADARVLGSVDSAPMGEVLAEALSSSDNALTENLARQAAIADGADGTPPAVADWVHSTLEDAGVDLTGVKLVDACGLSKGQRVPAAVLSEVMQLGITGSAKSLRGVLLDLPVAGVGGTLQDRFTDEGALPATGIARAKTGTLTGASGLAGTTVTKDGRVLTYAILADRVPTSTGTLGARAVLDRLVGTLTSCGCR